MAETMRAAVLHSAGDLRIEEVPRAQITSPHEALVRVEAVGICGSDMHYFQHGRIGDYVVREPMTLGHEAAGEVVAVGEEVTQLKPGDRVAIEPGYTCRRCEFCKAGRYNLCADVIFMATPPIDGAFCDYVAWPADYLFKLPERLSYEEGAMMEPLAVGVHAAARAAVSLGNSVAVLGAGPIGLVTLQAATAAGAALTIVTDVIPFRLRMATQLGATHVLDAQDDVAEAVEELTGGRGVDVVADCVGLPETIRQATQIARRGGHIQAIGLAAETVDQFPLFAVINKELSLAGSFRYANRYPAALAAVAAGAIDVQAMITHRFPLTEAPEAMAWVAEHKDQVIKAIIRPDNAGDTGEDNANV